MTLSFNEKIVNNESISSTSFKNPNFVGFLNPNGIPIDFKDKYGYTGHGEIPSIQGIFRAYYFFKFKDSKLISPLEEHIMNIKCQYGEKEKCIKNLKEMKTSLQEEVNKWN